MKEIIVRDSMSVRSPEELVSDIGIETERIVRLTKDLGRVGMVDAALYEALNEGASRLAGASEDLLAAARNTEVAAMEPFGGEESYWTVYRMFTVGDNLGRPRPLDDIRAYLDANYDLSRETDTTLAATIDEWGNDIEADAAERGIRGSFIRVDGGYCFAGYATHVPEREPEVVPAPPESVVVPRLAAESQAAGAILAIVSDSPEGIVKQASLKKRLVADAGMETTEAQAELDRLVARGVLFKFRRDKVAHVSVTPRDDEYSRMVPDTQEITEVETFDGATALDILRVLAAPGTHVQRKSTLAELWRDINGVQGKSQALPDDMAELLKTAARQLASMGYVTAGSEKIGTGSSRAPGETGVKSSRRRRSSTMQVYKVGLVSQDVKKDVQALLERRDALRLLEARFASQAGAPAHVE